MMVLEAFHVANSEVTTRQRHHDSHGADSMQLHDYRRKTARTPELPYKCIYCSNRFKLMQDAKRHQISVHVRRKFWSYSVLQETTMHVRSRPCGRER